MKLKLLEFIKENSNWKELLQEKPFSITIKEDENYYLFSYSQIDSDFSNDIVKECRGIILSKSDFHPVCVPFLKFFNVQETNASFINWNTARVQQKIDGSIIKVWFDRKWHISTNGTINASTAELSESALLMDDCIYSNYLDLFLSVFPQELFYNVLETNKTYMFEIVSPYNRIVVPYPETKIYHIGTRNNETLEECNDDIGVEKPKEYGLYSLTSCLEAVQELPFSDEGYVVVDNHWNRVKIKSPAYVAAHHLKNNGVITMSRIVDMIRANGQDDFVSIYPEYKDIIHEVEQGIMDFVVRVLDEWDDNFRDKTFESRKDFAMIANKLSCPAVMYSIQDKKVETVSEWLFNQTNEKILKWIGIE